MMFEVSRQDREIAQRWWSSLRQIVPAQVAGLWFGLTTLVHDGTATTTLYMAGASEFDPDDETGDWAAGIIWWPEDRYVELPGLASIPASDWPLALDYASRLVNQVMDPALLAATVRGVGVGWDDGDAKIVWSRS